MARPPRLHLPGGVYHVILRGNARQDIFLDLSDRQYFYGLLEEGVQRYGHRIHAFCCMTNHVHLAVQAMQKPLSLAMHNLSFRYARWFNHRYQRVGHLFQGRYRAILVDHDRYLLELVRYIHLNPVRAGLVDDPADFRWSSHGIYLEHENIPWVTTDWVLSQFGKTKGAARRAYESFIAAGLNEGYREAFHRGPGDSRILGDDDFAQRVLNSGAKTPLRPPRVEAIVDAVCEAYKLTHEQLASASRERRLAEARGVVAWLVATHGSATLTQLAGRFARDVSALSVAVRRIEMRRSESHSFRQWLDQLNKSLIQ